MEQFDNVYNFQPNSEEERVYFETHSGLSKAISKMIRSLPQEQRFEALKAADPTDTSLMALYLWALKQEDYETCEPAKALLIERGITNIPS
jgi:hypothetical protein